MLGNPSKLSSKTARKVPVVHVGEADLAPTGLTLSLTKQALRLGRTLAQSSLGVGSSWLYPTRAQFWGALGRGALRVG